MQKFEHPARQELNLPDLNQTAINLAEIANALSEESFHDAQADNLIGATNELLEPSKNRFSRAQSRLEVGEWTDTTRRLAVEINQADQEANEITPLSLDEALGKVAEWSNNDMADDDLETRRDGRKLDDALRLLNRPFKDDKVEALDTMLNDVEQTLAGFAKSRMSGMEADIQEYRAVRDALFAGRESAKAPQPCNPESKVQKTSTMDAPESPSESTQAARQSVDEAYTSREADLEAQIPDDDVELWKFGAQFEDLDLSKTDLFKAYTAKVVKSLADQAPEGVRYPDTIVAVFGNSKRADTAFLYELVSDKLNRRLDPNDFMRLRFSEVAELIGIDVKRLIPDYDNRFNTERGLVLPR